jgi:chromosome segregation ATPase
MLVSSERVSMLELQNSVLRKTAHDRAERITQLERELQRIRTLPPDTDEYIRGLHRELEQARQGTRGELQQELKRVEAELKRVEAELKRVEAELKRVEAEREFYCKRVAELEEQNRVVTEAATKYSLWGQMLFRELATLDPDGAPRRGFDIES